MEVRPELPAHPPGLPRPVTPTPRVLERRDAGAETPGPRSTRAAGRLGLRCLVPPGTAAMGDRRRDAAALLVPVVAYAEGSGAGPWWRWRRGKGRARRGSPRRRRDG